MGGFRAYHNELDCNNSNYSKQAGWGIENHGRASVASLLCLPSLLPVGKPSARQGAGTARGGGGTGRCSPRAPRPGQLAGTPGRPCPIISANDITISCHGDACSHSTPAQVGDGEPRNLEAGERRFHTSLVPTGPWWMRRGRGRTARGPPHPLPRALAPNTLPEPFSHTHRVWHSTHTTVPPPCPPGQQLWQRPQMHTCSAQRCFAFGISCGLSHGKQGTGAVCKQPWHAALSLHLRGLGHLRADQRGPVWC